MCFSREVYCTQSRCGLHFLPFPRVFATFPFALPAGAFSFLLAPSFAVGLAGAGAACSNDSLKYETKRTIAQLSAWNRIVAITP